MFRISPKAEPQQSTFICGCGHSGTTLLANMLASHPKVFIPLTETSAFVRLKNGRPEARNFSDAQRQYSKLLKSFEKSSKEFLCEKTPRHVHVLDLIRSVVPGAKFILLVRDGRDVAASFQRRYGSPEKGIERWTDAADIIIQEQDADDAFVLRYEDLIDDPSSKLENLCRFVGLEFDLEMLNYHKKPKFWFGQTQIRKSNGADGKEHLALRNWQVNQPIFDARGAWKDKLAASEVSSLENGPAGQLMKQFGYL